MITIKEFGAKPKSKAVPAQVYAKQVLKDYISMAKSGWITFDPEVAQMTDREKLLVKRHVELYCNRLLTALGGK